MPQSQDPQRPRGTTERAARPNTQSHAGGPEGEDRRGRRETTGAVGTVPGAGARISCAQPPRGNAGDVHLAALADSGIAAQMFGDDQRHRETAERGVAPYTQCYAMG